MGKRINFLKNNTNSTVFELIIEHYVDFKNWYLIEEKTRFEKYNEDFGNENLKQFFKKNSNLDLVTLKNCEWLDSLMAEFVIESWDKGDEFFEFFAPNMYRSHYDNSYEMIQSVKDQELSTLWTYITVGRDFSNYHYRQTFFDDLSVGFLERDEYLLLQQKIEHHFGDISTLRKLNHIGLECMLQTISELTQHNRQLISIIEL